MADYFHTVTHSVTFADANGLTKDKPDVVACIANDYAKTYGRVLVTVTRRGEGTVNALAGVVEFAENLVMEVMAKQQAVNERDLQQSRSMYRVGDTKWRLTAGDCEFKPQQGDQVTAPDGTVYDVLGVDTIVLGTRYVLWCRDAR